MGKSTGRDGVVKLTEDQVVQVRGWSLDETGDTAEDTVIGQTSRTHQASMKSWAGSLDLYYDPDDVVAEINVGDTVTLELYPQGEAEGFEAFTGSAIVTGNGKSGTFDAMIDKSFSFIGSGELARTVNPAPPLKKATGTKKVEK